jgi:hypothetical protein
VTDNVKFRWRLNGIVIPQIKVRREIVNGEPKGKPQIAVYDPGLGWFAIDNNENLWDPALSHFVLEVKDLSLPLFQRRWKKITIPELLSILADTGVLK